jgi:glycerol uptake facilitator-like aquaporin
MLSHILAEIIGTFVYVGAHHASQSNPLITSLALFVSMTLFNSFAGEVGTALNPLASLVSYITKEEPLGEILILIVAQICVALSIGWAFNRFSFLKVF